MNDKKRLAIHGGPAAHKEPIPPMFPGGMLIDEKEEAAVISVLRSKRLFRYYGPNESDSRVDHFENKFAEETSTEYALGLNSCTNALFIALVAAGVQPGDEVIIPAYTFVASAAAVVAANAIPVIVEIDDSYTINPEAIEKNITERTKAILPVHMRGVACDMDAIMKIAKKHGLKVIEDAAQANGGSYKGRPLGSIGDAGCFSFQFHKIITAGEGGVITSSNRTLINRAKALHDTGANWRSDSSMAEENDEYPCFPGYNFRMNELTAAILEVQLERRAGLLQIMRSHAAKLKNILNEYPDVSPRKLHDSDGDVGICVMFAVNDRNLAITICEALNAEGLSAGTMGSKDVPDWHIYSHWKHILNKSGNNDSGFPFNLTDREYSEDMCPETTDLLRRTVHLDVNPLYTESDLDEISEGLRKVLNHFL